MTARRIRSTKTERGFFTIWVLGLCMILMGLGGIAYDVTHALMVRKTLASLCDSAAIAGATQLDLAAFKADGKISLDENAAEQAALQYLAQNAADDRITFLAAPDIDATDTELTITATTRVDMVLMRLFAPGQHFDVTTHSAAAPQEAR